MNRLNNKHEIDNGKICHYCNNQNVVDAVNDWTVNKITPNSRNVDLLSATLKLHDRLPITISCKHVCGHQDDTTPYHLLSPKSQRNIDMDLLAKQLSAKLLNMDYTHPEWCNHPSSLPTCKWKDMVILQCSIETLYYNICKEKMEEYW